MRGLAVCAGVFLTMAVTHNVSVSDAGMFFLIYSVANVLASFSTLGLNLSFVKNIGSNAGESSWGKVNGIFYKGSSLVLCISLIVSFLIIIFRNQISAMFFDKSDVSGILFWMGLVIPGVAISRIVSFAFLGIHKSIIAIFLDRISYQIAVTITILVCAFLGIVMSVEIIMTAFALSAIFTMVLGVLFWKFRGREYSEVDYSQANHIYKGLGSFFLIMAMPLVAQYSSQLVLSFFADLEQISYFSVAQRISMLVSILLVAVNFVVAPYFAKFGKMKDMAELRAMSLLCSRLMLCLATPVVLLIMLFPQFLMGLFGEEYVQSAYLLQILIIGQFINVSTGSVGMLLNMTGHEKDMRNIALFSGPLGLMLCLILIPTYGSLGAAIATAFAIGSQNIMAVYLVKKRLGFNTLNVFKQ